MNQTETLVKRTLVFLIAIVAAIVLIGIIRFTTGPALQEILLDSDASYWPFTIQNIMELVLRWSAAKDEESQLKRGYLPTDERQLDAGLLVKIRDSIASRKFARNAFLPRMISRTIDQYRMSGDKGEALNVMNASLELYMHEIDLRYSILRYLTWLIPSLGFIGTVMGIMFALQYAGIPANAESEDFLYQVTQRLGVAFTTTLLALIMSAVLVLIQSMVQAKEERALNAAGQYTIDNLILRLGNSENGTRT